MNLEKEQVEMRSDDKVVRERVGAKKLKCIIDMDKIVKQNE